MISRLRQAVRSLARSPGFTVTAVLTVAIAIGINAAIFSILRAVVLSPLPYRDPGRVVAAWEVLEGEGGQPWRVSPKTFLAWRERSHVFSGLAAFGGSRATLTGAGDPVALQGSRVSDGYFDVLGVAPRLGRTFRSEDILPGAAPVVLIAELLWKTRFGGDRAVLGRSLLLDGKPKMVIGVMPSLFLPLGASATTTIEFGSDAAFWTPADLTAAAARRGRSYVLGVVGRLSPGVDRARAEREMTALQQALRKEDGGNKAIAARLRSLTDEAEGAVRPALLLVWAAVLLVLLIACVNVSNLHFARSETRRRELAIRAALGGSRPRLVGQLLVESLVLALAGGVLGILLAFWALPLLLRLVPAGLPRLSDVSLSGGTVAFGLLLSVAAGILFGLAPAIHLTHAGLEEDLRSTTRSGSQSKRSRRALAGMVIAEITLASMLVVGAGLLTRSFGRLTGVDLGFRSSRVLVLPVPIPQSTYDRWQKVASYQDALLSRLRAEPGVVSAALAYNHPLEAQWSATAEIVGRPAPSGEPEHSVWFRSVSEGYFRTLGVPLRQGRDFDVRDDAAHPGVAIVNETFARREFPGQSPIGRRLHAASAAWTW
ncbi:MAG: ABC transporter permease, partial [Acidobacteriota bacterium]|nr:ABC transporter permease [Acidobacteriota bacterium]